MPMYRSSPNPKAQNVKLLKIRWARSAWTKPLVTNVAYSRRCTRPFGRSRLRSIRPGARYRPTRPMSRIVANRSDAAGAPEVRRRSAFKLVLAEENAQVVTLAKADLLGGDAHRGGRWH